LRRLCADLCIDFDEEMLDQHVVSRGFTVGRAGFDPDAAERWRTTIGPVARAVLTAVLRPGLRATGYEP
jgi:hypothetical protein